MMPYLRAHQFNAIFLSFGFSCGQGVSDLAVSCIFNMLWNLLDCPAGIVPVKRVSADEEAQLRDRWPTVDKFGRKCRQVSLGSVGLTVGVQVVALPWQDATCLQVMRAIEAAVACKQKSE